MLSMSCASLLLVKMILALIFYYFLKTLSLLYVLKKNLKASKLKTISAEVKFTAIITAVLLTVPTARRGYCKLVQKVQGPHYSQQCPDT